MTSCVSKGILADNADEDDEMLGRKPVKRTTIDGKRGRKFNGAEYKLLSTLYTFVCKKRGCHAELLKLIQKKRPYKKLETRGGHTCK